MSGPDLRPGWQTLWSELTRALRRSQQGYGDAVDVEDVAAETVLRALARFGATPDAWPDVLRWCSVVARHRIVDRVRRARRVQIDSVVAAEVLAAVQQVDAEEAISDPLPWIAEWRPALSPGDRATLDLLVAGVHDNGCIAALRGRTLRAVQASRRRIASAAEQACGQESLPTASCPIVDRVKGDRAPPLGRQPVSRRARC